MSDGEFTFPFADISSLDLDNSVPVDKLISFGSDPSTDSDSLRTIMSVHGDGANGSTVKIEAQEIADFQQSVALLKETILKDRQQKKEAEAGKQQVSSILTKLLDFQTKYKDVLPAEQMAELGETISAFADEKNLGLQPPSFLTDIRYMSALQGQDGKGVISKIVARIPKFDGKSKEYTWPQFLTSFSIAVSNASYKDYELRAIFLNSLEGNALEHYQAHQDEYRTLQYDALVEKFAERYGPKKRIGLHSIIGIAQGVNEDVLSFQDRLLNTAAPFLPEKPSMKHLFRDSEGKSTLVDNYQYTRDMDRYRISMQQHEMYIIRFFINGLRDEILQKLSTTDFESLDAAVEAAKVAEEYLKAVQQIKTHHIKVNALSSTEGTRYGRSERQKTQGTCHTCGREGHWSKDCPNASRSRRGSVSRSRDNSRNRASGSGQDNRDLAGLIEKLCTKVDELQSSRPSRKGKHNKQFKNKQHHQEQRRSRSNSRTRSSSQPRYKSRSNSQNRSRSNSKNGRR